MYGNDPEGCGCCPGPRGCCDTMPGEPHDRAGCTATPAMREAMAGHDELFHDGSGEA